MKNALLELGEVIALGGERLTVVQINETHARVTTIQGAAQIIPRSICESYIWYEPRMREIERVNELHNILAALPAARAQELSQPITVAEMKETVMPSQPRKRTPRTVPSEKKPETKPKLGAWFQKRMDFVKSLIASKTGDDEIWNKTKKKFPSSDRHSVDKLVKSLQ